MGYTFSPFPTSWTNPTHKTPINPIVAFLPHLFLFLGLALPPSLFGYRLPRFIFFPAVVLAHNWVAVHYTTDIPAADYGVGSFAATMTFKAIDLLGDLDMPPEQRFFRGVPGVVPDSLRQRRSSTTSVENDSTTPQQSPLGPVGAWERTSWALGLMTSMRGVGWNWQARNVPPPSQQSRLSFIFSQSAKFCALYIGMDLLSNLMQSHPYFISRASISSSSFLDALLIRVSAFFAAYGALNTQYTLLSVIGVTVGWGGAKDWRPLFGFGGLAEGGGSVGRFWSQIWHQSYQRSLTVLSTHMNRILHIPSLFLTFFFSAVLHHAGTVALLPSLSFIHSSTAHFFLLQPFAIFFERFVLFRYLDKNNPLLWVWTVVWILGSGGLIFEENVRAGLWEVEAVPFSVVRWVAGKIYTSKH